MILKETRYGFLNLLTWKPIKSIYSVAFNVLKIDFNFILMVISVRLLFQLVAIDILRHLEMTNLSLRDKCIFITLMVLKI